MLCIQLMYRVVLFVISVDCVNLNNHKIECQLFLLQLLLFGYLTSCYFPVLFVVIVVCRISKNVQYQRNMVKGNANSEASPWLCMAIVTPSHGLIVQI